VTTLLADTSVLIKWFHAEGEPELQEALAILSAAQRGDVECRMIDLALYEMGNVLLGPLGWTGSDVADQLDDLIVICGAPLAMTPAWLRRTAELGEIHGLTFYDAAWAASAVELGVPLVSGDRRLISCGLAESPTSIAQRLRLPTGM
jgi:predicted nucleic acid-binding protein